MLNSDVLDALPEILVSRIEGANEYMLKKAGEHINKLGRLTASDIHRLDELRRASADVREVKRELSKVTKQNVSDIQQLFDWVAAQNYEESRAFYEWRGLNYIPYEQNKALQRMVQSMAQRTAESYVNLSQTTVVNVLKHGDVFAEPLEKGYADVIDQAVTNAAMGVQDYHSAIRDTLRTFSTGGLSVLYESGVTRRMDTAARMNILEGIRQVNQGVQDKIGVEVGADGVEISAHGFCAPDHEDIQGKQLSDAEYAKWTEMHAYPRRKIGVLNCHHFAFRIILGVNEPTYSGTELAEMKRKNAEGVTFEGKHYTMYEATQIQRELETRVRREKDKQILAKESGDDDLRREAQGRINLLASKYKKFSDAAGLSYKADWMSVSGYHKVKTNSQLTNGSESCIIKSTKTKDMNMTIDIFTPCLEDVNTGKLVSTTYSLANKNELKNLVGWKFNWTDSDLDKSDIYKLTIKGDNKIQGLIALTKFERDKAIYVNIAESSPKNFGKNKAYNGVGGHLFAIAAKRSVDLGYGGFVFMDAKNVELVAHYRNKLGAVLLGRPHPYRMFIDEEAANRLLDIYTLEEV